MNKHSPLQVGDILLISETALEKALSLFPGEWNEVKFKVIGHAVQFSHDELFVAAGWDIEVSTGSAPYDRIVNGIYQDDKAATFMKKDSDAMNVVPYENHTISGFEEDFWNRLRRDLDQDTVVQSFEAVDKDHIAFYYRGPLSWLAMRGHLGKPEGQFGNRKLFRSSSYKHNLL